MSINDAEDVFGGDGPTDSGHAFASAASVGVIRAGRRDYAVGLQWHAIQDPGRAKAEARFTAASPADQAEFYCIKDSGTPQFGLGYRAQGHKSGMPSLAAHLAAVRGGSWIGLFEAGGGWYLVAVRDDGILSECDRFFHDRDEAKAEFEEFLAASDWPEAIAPAELDVPGTVGTSIDDLISGRPPVRLRDVSQTSLLVRVGAGALLVGGVVVGGMLWQDHNEQMRLEQMAMQALQDAQAAISPEEEIVIPPMPWEGRLMAVPLIDACVEGVHAFPTDIPGFTVSQFFCTDGPPGQIAAAIDRDGTLGGGLGDAAASAGGGSYNWIQLMVHREGFTPRIDFPPEGSGARFRAQWSLEDLPSIPVDIDTARVRTMQQFMLEQMEERMTPVTFQSADNNEFWTGFSFSFRTQEDPRVFSDVIGALPGAMVGSMEYDVPSGVWTVEGRAYEQLPIPEQR